MVELLKDSAHYLVASLPGKAAALGFAALRDVNTFGIDSGVRFKFGQNVRATVAALPDAVTGKQGHHGIGPVCCFLSYLLAVTTASHYLSQLDAAATSRKATVLTRRDVACARRWPDAADGVA